MTCLSRFVASLRARASRCLLLALALTLACAAAANADTFSNGQFLTYTQGAWGAGGDAASILAADYNSVYASTNGVLIVGVENITDQFSITFSNMGAVLAYLPSTGTAGPLNASLVNPAISSSGILGGEVVALTLNVDFSNDGFILGTSGIPFGDLLLANFSGSLSGLNGLTVSQFLAIANTCLGDGSCPYGAANVAIISDSLNSSFGFNAVGAVSPFADGHLALPASPPPMPEPSSLLLLAFALPALAFFHRRAKGEELR
jgi:hypothetical protein